MQSEEMTVHYDSAVYPYRVVEIVDADHPDSPERFLGGTLGLHRSVKGAHTKMRDAITAARRMQQTAGDAHAIVVEEYNIGRGWCQICDARRS